MTTPHIEVRKTPDTTPHGRSPGARRPLPVSDTRLAILDMVTILPLSRGVRFPAESPSRRPDKTVAETPRTPRLTR